LPSSRAPPTGNAPYVLEADGTVILHFGPLTGGTQETLRFCTAHGRPHLSIDGSETPPEKAAQALGKFADELGIGTLNVAGPRLSKEPRAYDYAFATILALLRHLKS
jgi:Circularly permutated YpsA SLOG family